jgi:hypothetical protein
MKPTVYLALIVPADLVALLGSSKWLLEPILPGLLVPDRGPDHLYHLWPNCIKSLNVHPPRSEMNHRG